VANAGDPLRVRQEAALAVGKLAPADAAGKLGATLDAAAGDRDAEDLRIALVQALGSLRSPEARSALERHARRTLGDRERVFVQQALRE
jgi:HEAT repeat protein